jgi:glycogen operon protein
MAFVTCLIELRRNHPVFRRRNFFLGRSIKGTEVKDIHWLKPDGAEMSDEEWANDFARCLGVFLAGDSMQESDRQGRPVHDENFLLLFNAHHEVLDFKLPELHPGSEWIKLLDTCCESEATKGYFRSGESYPLRERSLVLLMENKPS